MSNLDFSGCHLPIITPFKDDGSLNEDGLRKLINYYIEEIGVNGIVPCGTTGESPTLTNEEHDRVIEITVEETRGRVPVIAGTGSNSTSEAIERTRHAEAAGADACLLISPYYNKPTQDGLVAHYEALAAATKLPLLIYNIPGRTGRNVEPATIIKLAKIDNIVGVKDCSNDLAQTTAILRGTADIGKPFYVLSGDDAMTYTMMALGAHGVIAASAHLVGAEYVRMSALMHECRFAEAREIHYQTLDLVNTLFIESNPVPVKEALEMMGLPAGPPRLPLVPLREENREKLQAVLLAAGKI